jgi:hypothetical protein
MQDGGDALDVLAGAMRVAGITLTTALLPALIDFTNWLTSSGVQAAFRDFSDEMSRSIAQDVRDIEKLIAVWRELRYWGCR